MEACRSLPRVGPVFCALRLHKTLRAQLALIGCAGGAVLAKPAKSNRSRVARRNWWENRAEWVRASNCRFERPIEPSRASSLAVVNHRTLHRTPEELRL